MRRVLPPISAEQAKVLLEALQSYQEENASLMHSWEITDHDEEDVEQFTGIVSLWGSLEELIQFITTTFPENPAN